MFLLKNKKFKSVKIKFLAVHDKTLIPRIIAQQEGTIRLSETASNYLRSKNCHLELSKPIYQTASTFKMFYGLKERYHRF